MGIGKKKLPIDLPDRFPDEEPFDWVDAPETKASKTVAFLAGLLVVGFVLYLLMLAFTTPAKAEGARDVAPTIQANVDDGQGDVATSEVVDPDAPFTPLATLPLLEKMNSGVLCDTKGQVIKLLMTDMTVPGCKFVQDMPPYLRPLLVRAYPLETYEDNFYIAQLVRFEIPFPDEIVVKYGIYKLTKKNNI